MAAAYCPNCSLLYDHKNSPQAPKKLNPCSHEVCETCAKLCISKDARECKCPICKQPATVEDRMPWSCISKSETRQKVLQNAFELHFYADLIPLLLSYAADNEVILPDGAYVKDLKNIAELSPNHILRGNGKFLPNSVDCVPMWDMELPPGIVLEEHEDKVGLLTGYQPRITKERGRKWLEEKEQQEKQVKYVLVDSSTWGPLGCLCVFKKELRGVVYCHVVWQGEMGLSKCRLSGDDVFCSTLDELAERALTR